MTDCTSEQVFALDGRPMKAVRCTLSGGHAEWHQHDDKDGVTLFIWKGEDRTEADISPEQRAAIGMPATIAFHPLGPVMGKLAELGIDCELGSSGNYVDINRGDVVISIEPRPHYCNRGAYIVKVFSRSPRVHVDRQDGFPRYYFGLDACASEIRAWMNARGVSLAADAPAESDRPVQA